MQINLQRFQLLISILINFNKQNKEYNIVHLYFKMHFLVAVVVRIFHMNNQMKNIKYHTVATFPESNRKIIERGKICIP
jgi:hypothetical protein